MDKKEFWKSKSFWGLVITAAGIWAPKFATFLQGNLEQLITAVGLIVTLIGRWKATRPLGVTKPKE